MNLIRALFHGQHGPVGLALISLALSSTVHALDFNFNIAPGTPQIAIDGFVAAGERWSNVLTDDITVNITVAFGDIPSATGATILGATGTSIFAPPPGTTVVPDFPKLKDALAADATSTSDRIAVSNLPDGTSLSAFTNARDGSLIFDADGSGNNTFFSVTTANAKALGLLDPDLPGEDATVSFNSAIAFDFDPSDGITPGATDFIGVAVHEFGHALGYTSGVDLVDAFTGSGPSASVDLNGGFPGVGTLEPFALFSTVDLFRRSPQSVDIGPDVFDLSTTPGAFFSIDGMESGLLLESGSFNGSGLQASHFLDNMGLGILDPTVAAGELLQITQNDIFALDVIGYDTTDPTDFNGDSLSDCSDVNALSNAIAAASNDPAFDLNGDGLVQSDDLAAWLGAAGALNLDSEQPFLVGDNNLDGTIDSTDLGILLNNFGDAVHSGYCDGDLNADGSIDSTDLGELLNNFGGASATNAVTVPEPSGASLLFGFLASASLLMQTLRRTNRE